MKATREDIVRPGESRPLCDVCGAKGRRWHRIDGFRLLFCDGCRHGWLEDVPDPEWLASLYASDYFQGGGAHGYPDYLAAEDAVRKTARGHLDVLDELHPLRGRLLDLGCAAGFLLDEARARGWETVGVEISEAMSTYAVENLGLTVHHGTCCQRVGREPEFDAVTMVQVLEHVARPVQCCLAGVAAQLRAGGTLLIETWDCDSWTARVSGRFWQQLSPPSVQHWFSERSLRSALERNGLEVLRVDRPGKSVDVDRVLSLVQDKYLPRLASLARRTTKRLRLDRATVPYPLDDILRVVARRV